MHALTQIHNGGHLYGPGGMGWREFDPAPLLSTEHIAETRDLPGFVDRDGQNAVTYESHHFWIHFCRYNRRDDGKELPDSVRRYQEEESKRDSSVLIRVNHGGGWEVWRGDYMLAKALRRYGGDDRGAFLLCWYLIDMARITHDAGRAEAAAEYRKAFAEDRLKKRKVRGQSACKIWIEPPKESAAA